MSVKSFKFVSPGVFINEIDNSFIPRTPDAIGPVVIGRSSRGLAMQPVKVESYSDFVNMFGDTVPGNGGGDISRYGNLQSPMYGTYAAKAFLNSGVAPLTYIRLLGQETTVGSAAGGDAAAGWKTTGTPTQGATAGGAYGLFVAASASLGSGLPNGNLTSSTDSTTSNPMRLGAIIYVESGSVTLQGTVYGTGSANAAAAATMILSDTNGVFKLGISGSNATRIKSINFDDTSDKFIRKRLNTNPQLTSDQGTFYPSSSYKDYWLGETFEQELRDNDLQGGKSLVGMIMPLASGSARTIGPANLKSVPSQEAVAGWFIGQDLGTATNYDVEGQQKLFRLIGRGHGQWLQKNVKVSIEKVRQSSTSTSNYGTFSLVLRQLLDTDSNVVVLERYDNLTLDPTSPNYIARKIGDQYQKWDSTSRRLKTYGEYPNLSKFVRVEMDAEVDAGGSKAKLLPFGYYAPPKFKDVTLRANDARTRLSCSFVVVPTNAANVPGYYGPSTFSSSFAPRLITASFAFPSVRLRSSSVEDGLSDPTNAYFGMSVTRTSTSTRPDASVLDVHNLLYASLGQTSGIVVDNTAATYTRERSPIDGYAYVFSLDNVKKDDNGIYVYVSGSRKADTSYTATSGTNALMDAGYNRFTAPFWGGSDGFDITKPDPLYNKGMTATSTVDNSYAYNTYKQAIDTIADPEYLNMNLLNVPGLTVDSLTTHAINVCEERGDAMAVVDLADVYIPPHEQYYSDKSSRIGTTPSAAATALRNRQIDSSYGCTFYPWVQTRDAATGQLVWIPPSVAMMGVLGSSEAASQVWFAPAGFNRGGLTDGAAGIPVVNVTERVVSKDRDLLYEANINPIATFPSSGIVVFGQKTLQERQSALDRINVRRLVIYLKKQISVLSTQVLFDQNVQSTWNRFKGLIEPFLANVKVQYGITDYRLILDSSTTTPDLIDQNILYAKIMIKPARAIEYIAIDFVIASTGASFDD